MPGVLAAVNGVLAEHGVNIEGQLLATRGELGYLLTDAGRRRRPRRGRGALDAARSPCACAVLS